MKKIFFRLPTKIPSEILRLLANVSSLSALQAANLLLPLITVPYIVRTVGVDGYGKIAVATATTIYISIFVDYGFNISATRSVSQRRNERSKVDDIYSSVLQIRLSIATLGAFGLAAALHLRGVSIDQWVLFSGAYLQVLANAAMPRHIYHGLEVMKPIAVITIALRALSVLVVFFLISDPSDYALVPAINGGAAVGAAILVLIHAKMVLGVTFKPANRLSLVAQLKDGWSIFASTLSTSLYTASATLIIGASEGAAAAGYFSGADKIIQAVKGLLGALLQATYPIVARRLYDHERSGVKFAMRILWITTVISAVLSLLILIWSEEICRFILGKEFAASSDLLRIMSPLPLLVGMSNVLGVQIMVSLGMKRKFGLIVGSAGILGVCLNYVLIQHLGTHGAAVSIVAVEALVTAIMLKSVFSRVRRGVAVA